MNPVGGGAQGAQYSQQMAQIMQQQQQDAVENAKQKQVDTKIQRDNARSDKMNEIGTR